MISLKWMKSLTNFYWLDTNARMSIKQPRFICSACGPFKKHCGRIQKFRETVNTKHLYRN